MTRWAKTLGTNGWGATPSHHISLVSTMWFDESKVWLPRRSVGESALVISSAWCKKYRAVYPALLTATYLNTALRESTTFWWRISFSMRVPTTFNHFRFCCRCRFCFLLLFCFIFFFCTTISRSNTETILSMIKALCDTLTWVPLFVLFSTRVNQVMHGEKSYKDRL